MLILGAAHGEGSLRGMWLWGCKRWSRLRGELGFMGNPDPPVYATVWGVVIGSKLPRRLDADALEKVLREWTATWASTATQRISVDGKVLRGSRRAEPEEEAVVVVAAASHELKGVLGQQVASGGDQTSAVVALLSALSLEGKLVTADAGLLNRQLVQTVIEGGGDYLGLVKDNQPELKKAVDDWVDPQVSPPPLKHDRRT